MAVGAIPEPTLCIESVSNHGNIVVEGGFVVFCKKTATVFSHFLNEGVRVVYEQNVFRNQSVTFGENCEIAYLSDGRASIEISHPLSYKVIACGWDAKTYCEQELCRAIESFYIKKGCGAFLQIPV